jgi:hypothetical protein
MLEMDKASSGSGRCEEDASCEAWDTLDANDDGWPPAARTRGSCSRIRGSTQYLVLDKKASSRLGAGRDGQEVMVPPG